MVNWLLCAGGYSDKNQEHPMELNGVTCSARGVSPGVCLHWQVFNDHVCIDRSSMTIYVCMHWQVFLWPGLPLIGLHWPTLVWPDKVTQMVNPHFCGIAPHSSLHLWPAEYWHVHTKRQLSHSWYMCYVSLWDYESTWVHMSLPADTIHLYNIHVHILWITKCSGKSYSRYSSWVNHIL